LRQRLVVGHRRRNTVLKKLLMIVLFATCCFATTVTGKFATPGLQTANGVLYFTLIVPGGRTAIQVSTPQQIVPGVPVSVVLNSSGAIPGSITLVGNDDLEPSDTYYSIAVRDSKGNLLGTQNVYITGVSADLGTVTYVSSLPTVPTFTPLLIAATSSTITPGAVAANTCYLAALVPVAGAANTMAVAASPQAGLGSGFVWSAWVASAGNIQLSICNVTAGSLTPTATAWNVRVIE
ncbi:MAG: hypothetical protein KGL39_41020, partial [Patescibacteria group bacterium]|nr:hypothetical protein [Patescibacteria group bacterium]